MPREIITSSHRLYSPQAERIIIFLFSAAAVPSPPFLDVPTIPIHRMGTEGTGYKIRLHLPGPE